ncbi:MAG TPA: DNA-3-methyladenine glycosylase I [Candidatus Limnocylindrales bacterium]|nr:DNA-3-methyladenine glycosylase I [Candidatus Limnocylindrales bacterium]
MPPTPAIVRCSWADSDPLSLAYHDEEWGVPTRDDRQLFELLCLEGAQAGLSWITILRKRDGYRRAFDGFDPVRLAAYGEGDVERLMADAGIVRNRAKIASAIGNAHAFLRLAEEIGPFADHLWSFVDGKAIQNEWASTAEVPSETDASRAMARDLKRRGFGFIGPTVAYAFMQSAGLVNDHVVTCYRHAQLAEVE